MPRDDGEEIIVADGPALARQGALWFADRVEERLADTGRFSVALAGGTTPRGLYRACADLRLMWGHIDFYFGDERCVPPDHPDSNYAMAKAAFFDEAAIPAENVHRIAAEREDREAAAAEYAAALPERLDLVILGMGEDGHTASLFPGARWPAGRRVIVVSAPKPPPWRITITPVVIQAARARLVLATGAAKAARVAEALGPDVGLPVQLARPATWLLDRAAAAKLEQVE